MIVRGGLVVCQHDDRKTVLLATRLLAILAAVKRLGVRLDREEVRRPG